MGEVLAKALELIAEDRDGELTELLKRILRYEKEHREDLDHYYGFEWYQVSGDARTLHRLVTKGILKITFKTNKSTLYRVTDLEGLEKALEQSQEVEAQPEEPGEIPQDLFHVIIGHEEKKEILFRSIGAEKPVAVLLYGSIASAKTLFLEELARLPYSEFRLGSSLSKAGLLDLLFTSKPRYLILDELDKVDQEENLSALLSLMERGFIAETKYGKRRQLRLKTWVFASANRLDRIPPELLSRFTVLRFRDYTPEEYLEVAAKVLVDRERVDPSLAFHVAEKCLRELATRDVRDAVKVARLAKTKEEAERVINILKRNR